MKRLAMVAVALCAVALRAAEPSVNLKLERPKTSVTRTEGTVRGTTTETANTLTDYKGRVSCTPAKGETVSVKVEAHFVTRTIGLKGAQDEVLESREVGVFEFGGENPATQTFAFTSPPATKTTVSKTKGSRRNRKVTKTESGTRYLGVILRAVVGGRPVKVISEPNNPVWVKAGKEATVDLRAR